MNPTAEQVEYLKRACGTRRFIYNWGREHWEKQYQAYKAEQETVPQEQRVLKPPNALALKKHFNEIRKQEYPWTYEVTKCVVEGAFDDLRSAYENFFTGRANYPHYKKKGKSHESFYLSNDKFTLGSHWISIPGLGRFILDQRHMKKDRGKLLRTLGTVNLAEKLRFVEEGKATVRTKKRNQRKQVVCERVKILGATVSCEAGHWYVSIQVEIKKERPTISTAVVGVDVGLKQAAVVSDGRRLENQRPLALHLKKLGKLQRKLSRKQKTKDPETKRTLFSKHYEQQRRKRGPQAPADRQYAPGCAAQVHHGARSDLRSDGHRRPQHPGNDGQSEARSCRRRCGDGTTVAVPQDQSGQRRGRALHRLALVPLAASAARAAGM